MHPILLAAFPVLFLFAANLGEHVTIDPLVEPLALAVGAVALLLVLTVGLLRVTGLDAGRAALVVSVGVALFFSYGHAWQAADELLREHWVLLTGWALLAIGGTTAVLRASAGRVGRVTRVLNMIAALLVAINVVPIVGFALQEGSGVADGPASDSSVASNPSDPDIWYLVFDRYAGAPGLERAFGFDNDAFVSALEARGLAVYEGATANYLKTAHSLVSTLEMDFLDAQQLQDAAATPDDWAPLYRVLQGSHAVQRFLQERGYEYLHLGVRRGATYDNSAADRTFIYGEQTEFSAVLADTTLLTAIASFTTSDVLSGTSELYRNHSLYQMNVLEQLASARSLRPRFIFAHLLLPHPPYVFNADGSWVTTRQAAERTPEQQYIEQLRFANDRILALLDAIQASPDVPPVIVLQADEGPFPDRYARDELSFQWREATDAELVQKFSILAAYRVPGVSAAELELSSTPTPVNAFRAVFNALFDAGFETLPDRNLIFSDQRHIYDLIDATDRVQDAMQRP